MGFDLCGKTAGIVGTGKTGRIVGEILRGFRMRVLASDPYPNQEWAAQNAIEYVAMSTLMRESDLITLHAPLTPQTARIVNQETLALMKTGIMLINVSRGRLIHTKALIKALKSGHIGGVALMSMRKKREFSFRISRARSCRTTNWRVYSPFPMCS